jgi:hypothetical protein
LHASLTLQIGNVESRQKFCNQFTLAGVHNRLKIHLNGAQSFTASQSTYLKVPELRRPHFAVAQGARVAVGNNSYRWAADSVDQSIVATSRVESLLATKRSI